MFRDRKYGDLKLIPSKLRIGGYTVKVDIVDNLLRDQGCCGRFLPCDKQIEIDSSMCEEMQWGTFYHEIVEAMTEIYAIKPLAEDHTSIDILGEVLHQIMRDNGKEMLP